MLTHPLCLVIRGSCEGSLLGVKPATNAIQHGIVIDYTATGNLSLHSTNHQSPATATNSKAEPDVSIPIQGPSNDLEPPDQDANTQLYTYHLANTEHSNQTRMARHTPKPGLNSPKFTQG
jgi:hypothetical protein